MNNHHLRDWLSKRIDRLLWEQHHAVDKDSAEAIFDRGQIEAYKQVYLTITGHEWKAVEINDLAH